MTTTRAQSRLASAPFRFGYGSPALDLAVTLRRRGSTPIELLAKPEDGERWLQAAGLVSGSIRLDGSALEELRSLRDAIYRIGRAAVAGLAPPASDVRLINAAARLSADAPQLGGDWTVKAPRARQFDAALGTIARAAIALFGDEPQRALLRSCEQDDCAGLFLDRSRGERRRWCSMSRCGSRAKVAAFRQRQKDAQR